MSKDLGGCFRTLCSCFSVFSYPRIRTWSYQDSNGSSWSLSSSSDDDDSTESEDQGYGGHEDDEMTHDETGCSFREDNGEEVETIMITRFNDPVGVVAEKTIGQAKPDDHASIVETLPTGDNLSESCTESLTEVAHDDVLEEHFCDPPIKTKQEKLIHTLPQAAEKEATSPDLDPLFEIVNNHAEHYRDSGLSSCLSIEEAQNVGDYESEGYAKILTKNIYDHVPHELYSDRPATIKTGDPKTCVVKSHRIGNFVSKAYSKSLNKVSYDYIPKEQYCNPSITSNWKGPIKSVHNIVGKQADNSNPDYAYEKMIGLARQDPDSASSYGDNVMETEYMGDYYGHCSANDSAASTELLSSDDDCNSSVSVTDSLDGWDLHFLMYQKEMINFDRQPKQSQSQSQIRGKSKSLNDMTEELFNAAEVPGKRKKRKLFRKFNFMKKSRKIGAQMKAGSSASFPNLSDFYVVENLASISGSSSINQNSTDAQISKHLSTVIE